MGIIRRLKRVLQDNRMPHVQLCRQQAERRYHRHVQPISHGEQSGLTRVDRSHRCLIARIDFCDARLLIDKVRFEITELVQLVRDLVELRLPNRDLHHLITTDPCIRSIHRIALPTRVGKGIITQRSRSRERSTAHFRLVLSPLPQCNRHRDLVHAVLGQRHTDRIADTIAEQRADADGALDTTVFAIAGFRDTEMDRIVPVRTFLIQTRNEKPVGLDHHLRVRCLHREHKVVVVQIARDAGKL